MGGSGTPQRGPGPGGKIYFVNKNLLKLTSRWIPDLKSGWEYRPLVRTMDNLDSNTWHSDDGSLRIEYLRGNWIIFKGQYAISELFRC